MFLYISRDCRKEKRQELITLTLELGAAGWSDTGAISRGAIDPATWSSLTLPTPMNETKPNLR